MYTQKNGKKWGASNNTESVFSLLLSDTILFIEVGEMQMS